MKEILTEMNKDTLIKFENNMPFDQIIIIKFGATWCRPCQKIKKLCYDWFNKLPASITCVDIDIDENLELYCALKNKKMVNGIPALVAYYGIKKDHWFIPNDSVIGSHEDQINQFFLRCLDHTLKNRK